MQASSAQGEIAFGQGGFRFDSDPAACGAVVGLGCGVYRARSDWRIATIRTSPADTCSDAGARNLGGGRFQVQAYYDRTRRKVPLQFEEKRNAGDVDAQHEVRLGRHTLIGGGQLHSLAAATSALPGFSSSRSEDPLVDDGVSCRTKSNISPGRFFLIAGAKIGAQQLHRRRAAAHRCASACRPARSRWPGRPFRARFGCRRASIPTCDCATRSRGLSP